MTVCVSSSMTITVENCIRDNESYAIKHYLKMFAELASATLKQVADWFVWLASTLGRFFDERSGKAERNANERFRLAK